MAAGFGNRPAMTFEGDDGSTMVYSFEEVLEQVCATATVLAEHGVKKGDRVSLCMPMIPALAFAVLACARLGAVHSVVFAGFSAEAVAERIVNCGSTVVLTADGGLRGGKVVPLKSIVDRAIELAAARGTVVRRVLVTHRAGPGASPSAPGWVPGRDVSLDAGTYWVGWVGRPHERRTYTHSRPCPTTTAAVAEVYRNTKGRGQQLYMPPVPVGAEDPLFILYTSGCVAVAAWGVTRFTPTLTPSHK